VHERRQFGRTVGDGCESAGVFLVVDAGDELGATVTFLSRDSARIRMYLVLPPNYEPGKKYPLIVMPHGGPQARDYITYDDFAAFIASQGYLVARPNFRGSTGYGLEFEKAGYKQWGGVMQDDLQDAAQFLIRKGFAKEGSICLVGGSYGGYAALMGLIKHQNFYSCAVSVNGVTHLRDQLKFDEKRFKEYPDTIALLHESIGNPKTDIALLDANSPLLQVAKVNAPILLIAGTRDEVVPFKQSKAMFKALSKAKKPVEWIPLKDTYHNAWYFEEDRKTIYEEVGKFLSKHLQ
jgi:dipeptidyl aminopeptidase/acylaminoacyl peptidase